MRKFLARLVLIVGALAISLQPFWVSSNLHKHSSCALSQNAAWISVDWTSTQPNVEAIQKLAEDAEKYQLAYLFPYTTYLKPDRKFNATYDYAAEFVTQFRQHNQQTSLLAWIGIPVVNDRMVGISGWVDLSQESERTQIVDFVSQLITEAGFDGIHLNVETVQDGDPGYLELLAETKQAIGTSSTLSIASTYWLPKPLNNLPGLNGYRWTTAYYKEIASRVDQIVTMTYDSFMPHAALYRIWMKGQVEAIYESIAESNAELLIGLSVSEEKTLTHRPAAEYMASGLAGICAGIESLPSTPLIKGTAIYAFWEWQENDENEWLAWLHSQEQP